MIDITFHLTLRSKYRYPSGSESQAAYLRFSRHERFAPRSSHRLALFFVR